MKRKRMITNAEFDILVSLSVCVVGSGNYLAAYETMAPNSQSCLCSPRVGTWNENHGGRVLTGTKMVSARRSTRIADKEIASAAERA